MSARVTFRASPVIWIHVRGENRGPGLARDDGGLVARLLKWMLDEQIYGAEHVRGGYSGGGGYAGALEAERVIAWLREQGVTEVTS